MTGIIKRTTENFNLRIPVFDSPGWGREIERDLDIIDAAVFAISGLTGVVGIWTNGTTYNAGERVVDEGDNTVWECVTTHISPATGTFAEDRTANPTRWTVISSLIQNRGEWTTATDYKQNDFLYYNNQIAIVVAQTYTSSASFDTDVTNGNLLVIADMNPYLDQAAASATASANSATNSANSADASATSATASADSATASEVSRQASDTSATNSANSATSSSASATASENSATAAANSATTADARATDAETARDQAQGYATTASGAADTAIAARDQTLASFDSFDDRYLGAKDVDPVTDNDGQPLVAGAIFFDNVEGYMKVYTGTAWVAAYVSGTSFYTKSESDDRYYTKTLAGTTFLGINAKAADSDKLDGVDSTGYVRTGKSQAYLDDADALTQEGQYATDGDWVGSPYPGVDGKNQGYLQHFGWGNSLYALQLFTQINVGNHVWMRRKDSGVWQSWVELLKVGDVASDSAKLGGQLPAYYTDIITRLGYTPVNKAGDTMTGILTMAAGSIVKGTSDSSQFLMSSSDNNRLLEIYGNGAGQVAFLAYSADGVNKQTFAITYGADPTWNGNKIWHAGNDGAGSGLDADKLKGVDGANYARTDIAATFASYISAGVQVTATYDTGAGHYGVFNVNNSAGQRGGFFGWGDGATSIEINGDVATQFNFVGFNGVDFGGAALTNGSNSVSQHYSGSTANQVVFPLGHPIVVITGSTITDPNRNASLTLKLNGTLPDRYTDEGTAASLSGTWRSRGIIDSGRFLFQRTA